MGISARKQEREFMIGTNEVASQEARRSQAETNRNAAIEGMFTSAGAAITAGSKIKGKGKTFEAGDYNKDGYTDASDYAYRGQYIENN
jgi:hypothetical protein